MEKGSSLEKITKKTIPRLKKALRKLFQVFFLSCFFTVLVEHRVSNARFFSYYSLLRFVIHLLHGLVLKKEIFSHGNVLLAENQRFPSDCSFSIFFPLFSLLFSFSRRDNVVTLISHFQQEWA